MNTGKIAEKLDPAGVIERALLPRGKVVFSAMTEVPGYDWSRKWQKPFDGFTLELTQMAKARASWYAIVRVSGRVKICTDNFKSAREAIRMAAALMPEEGF